MTAAFYIANIHRLILFMLCGRLRLFMIKLRIFMFKLIIFMDGHEPVSSRAFARGGKEIAYTCLDLWHNYAL